MDWMGLAGVAIGIGFPFAGWIMALQGRLTRVETLQQAHKERLDGFESQILRRLDRIEEKLDELANNRRSTHMSN